MDNQTEHVLPVGDGITNDLEALGWWINNKGFMPRGSKGIVFYVASSIYVTWGGIIMFECDNMQIINIPLNIDHLAAPIKKKTKTPNHRRRRKNWE